MIRIRLNGEDRSVDADLTIASLLGSLGIPGMRLAVERNRRIVPREGYDSEPVEAGDRIEIVTLVGGG